MLFHETTNLRLSSKKSSIIYVGRVDISYQYQKNETAEKDKKK